MSYALLTESFLTHCWYTHSPPHQPARAACLSTPALPTLCPRASAPAPPSLFSRASAPALPPLYSRAGTLAVQTTPQGQAHSSRAHPAGPCSRPVYDPAGPGTQQQGRPADDPQGPAAGQHMTPQGQAHSSRTGPAGPGTQQQGRPCLVAAPALRLADRHRRCAEGASNMQSASRQIMNL